jgi:hypothetical protein
VSFRHAGKCLTFRVENIRRNPQKFRLCQPIEKVVLGNVEFVIAERCVVESYGIHHIDDLLSCEWNAVDTCSAEG